MVLGRYRKKVLTPRLSFLVTPEKLSDSYVVALMPRQATVSIFPNRRSNRRRSVRLCRARLTSQRERRRLGDPSRLLFSLQTWASLLVQAAPRHLQQRSVIQL